jgi:hypothetical protein
LYLSGDTNKNKLLNVDEIWKYTCTTYVSKTTTNIAVAEGTADDITVTDDDSVTVLVATPGFPNTGLPPASRAIALVVGAIVLIVISCVISYKKRSV